MSFSLLTFLDHEVKESNDKSSTALSPLLPYLFPLLLHTRPRHTPFLDDSIYNSIIKI